MLRFLLFSLLILIVAACDSSGSNDDSLALTSISGTWRGTAISADTVMVPVEIQIMQNLTLVTGSGIVDSPTGMFAFQVDSASSYFHPMVNIFLLYGRPPLGALNGIVSEDRLTINATMNGPGFSGPVNLEMEKVQQ